MISLLFMVLLITISPAHAEQTNVLLLSGTTIYTEMQETSELKRVEHNQIVHLDTSTETHSKIKTDDIEGYVRNNDIRHASAMHVTNETTTQNDKGESVTPLAFGAIVHVFNVDDLPLLLTTEGTWIERSTLSTSPIQPKTYYAKGKVEIHASLNGEPLGETMIGQSLVGYGITNGFLRIERGDRFGFVQISDVSEKPVKTGQGYALTTSLYYRDLGVTKLGTVPRGQLLQVYGIEGTYVRVLLNKKFVYVNRTSIANQMPSYAKSGSRYTQQDTPIYRDVDKKEIMGSLKRAQQINVYGTEGKFTRVLINKQFFFVETKFLGLKLPPYLSTGKRYMLKNTPLYSKATSQSKTSLSFKRGQYVQIYGASGTFTRVLVSGNYYFVPTNMTGTKNPPLYDSTGKQYIRYNNVSIYSTPSTSKRVTRMKRGQVVETFGTSGYYSRILVDGSYRYIATNYLTLNKPTARPKSGTVFYVQFNETPYFHTDVTYTKPAGTLKRGTKLIGLRSIDDDFWYAKLPSGKKVYVLNPYIAQTKPKSINVQRINPALHYATTKRTAFYANPNDKKPIGYIDSNVRVYPRGRSGDSYLIQYNWRPVYVKTTTIRVKQDPLTIKRNNTQKERFIAAAFKHLGTPYTWGSQSPRNGGFDCSGLIHYSSNQAGKIGGRENVSGYWYGNHFKQKRTSFTSGKRGDMIFFAGTYRNGPSHIGIMLSNEFFIHAGGETLQINSIHDPQWRPYFLGYKSL
ncbi:MULTISPECIES: C40 family peptidase [unclassified Exiguobacterium]|uniref:C40 family peptidase n=1 Tax=unclassified Exiguobacterium TaxID=2644629 RepID=UPI001EEFEEF8|nr:MULTISPECIES: C40 family peptidase [unclassified Exiguobacterium]